MPLRSSSQMLSVRLANHLILYAITLQSNIPKTLKASPFLKVSNDKKNDWLDNMAKSKG